MTISHLRLVDTDTGELVDTDDPQAKISALNAALARQENIIRALRNDKAKERQTYIRRATIEEIWEDWKTQTGKKRCRLTDDRFDAIRSMLEPSASREGYTLEEFKLVNLGIAHFPHVVYGVRRPTGSEDSKRLDLEYVCAKGARFEEAANLGYRVRKAQEDAA